MMPAIADVMLTMSAHQNMLRADLAKLRAAAAGTIGPMGVRGCGGGGGGGGVLQDGFLAGQK